VDFAFYRWYGSNHHIIYQGGIAAMKVEFYYDSTVAPGAAFPCDNAKATELVDKLTAKGVNAKATDLKGQQVAFMTYNAALTGPKAQVRAVFGAKGALQEDFGKTVPALMVFEKDADRYPTEAFPRSDKDLQRMVGCEEALQKLLEKA
jgi:hypothetical protein